MNRKLRGTRYMADMKTYANLPARLRNEAEDTVMLAYDPDKRRTWAEARDFCMKTHRMTLGTFKSIDARLKKRGWIRPCSGDDLPQTTLGIQRSRELIAEDIGYAVKYRLDHPDSQMGGVPSYHLLMVTYQSTMKRINDGEPAFEGLPQELRPEVYFDSDILTIRIVSEVEAIQWLQSIRKWLITGSR